MLRLAAAVLTASMFAIGSASAMRNGAPAPHTTPVAPVRVQTGPAALSACASRKYLKSLRGWVDFRFVNSASGEDGSSGGKVTVSFDRKWNDLRVNITNRVYVGVATLMEGPTRGGRVSVNDSYEND